MIACPVETVAAPIGVVWKLLTDPARWGTFFDVRIDRVEPPGQARAGQHVHGTTGPAVLRLPVAFAFTLVDESHHHIAADIRL
ncbi:MAG: SRPBCC family protein, partial [Candidatus Eremiobacteraeota bacterium]|nr:SRPBCC family protein [Candidatus Eremiobacteraeota bacterium]